MLLLHLSIIESPAMSAYQNGNVLSQGVVIESAPGVPFGPSNPIPTSSTTYTHNQYNQISVSSVTTLAAALAAVSSSIPSWATVLFMTAESGAFRYRADGTNPTTTVGQLVSGQTTWPLQGQSIIQAVALIALTGTIVIDIEFRG